MRTIPAKKLKEVLAQIPDNYPVIVSGEEHEYAVLISTKKTSVLIDERGIITEDYGETLTPSSVYGQRQEALELVFHQRKG